MRKILKYTKEYAVYLCMTVFIISLIYGLLHIGDKQPFGWMSNIQLLSALLGSAIVAAITFILLKGQERSQNMVQRNTRIFENKLQAYESFLGKLQQVVANNQVSLEDEKMLQFAVATISIHTQSKDLLKISECLKEIIQKIRTKESVNNSVWHELMEIVYIFQHSLYNDRSKSFDSNVELALRNFAMIAGYDDRIHSLLEYIECNLSSYRQNAEISTYIEDRCLHVRIRLARKYRIRITNRLPREIWLTLQIASVNGEMFNCRMGLYFPNDIKNNLDKVYCNKKLWVRQMSVIEDYGWRIGADTTDKVVGLGYNHRDRLSILTAVYDLINVINPLWVKKEMSILRKDKNGNIIKEKPYKKR